MIASGMRPTLSRFTLLTAVLIAAVSGCGESEENSSGANLAFGAFCDPGFAGDCPTNICRDVVGGESCDNISCSDWNRPSNQGTLCTKSCGDDSQCQDLSFATTNNEQVSDEEWFCESGICHVFVTAPPGQSTDVCTGCGGIFCAGRCIGCPQC